MTYNTEGIILKYRDVGEFDRIYTVLSAEHGKIDAWAQGVRKPKSKLVAHLQPLYFCDFMFARGRRFDRIAQVRIINRFPELWVDLQKLSHAIYATSLIDMVLRPGTKEKSVFELLNKTLTVISSEARNLIPSIGQGVGSLDPARDDKRGDNGVINIFSLKLLRETGFSPELHHCVICKGDVQGLSQHFDALRGGVLCNDCYMQSGHDAFSISALTLETLDTVLTSPLTSLEMPDAISRELATIAEAMMAAHFGEEPKARIFMDSLVRGLPQMATV